LLLQGRITDPFYTHRSTSASFECLRYVLPLLNSCMPKHQNYLVDSVLKIKMTTLMTLDEEVREGLY
jgi:hypothetical protein